MGLFDSPKSIERYSESNCGAGLRYGLSYVQGYRNEMQDDYNAITEIPRITKNISWFAVFDGHGGANVSKYCSKQLLDSLKADKEFIDALESEHRIGGKELLKTVKKGIHKGFLDTDEKVREIQGSKESGSTAVCALITETHLILSNCGDSRGMICTRLTDSDGSVICKPVLTTVDHKPETPSELERIKKADGYVFNNRIRGVLGVSRSFGDFKYKNEKKLGPMEQMVSPEPDFYIKLRENNIDEFVILACDGVWDVMSLEEVCDYVYSQIRITSNDLKCIADEIVDTCLAKGSRDNITIIIIDLKPLLKDEHISNEANVKLIKKSEL